MQLGDVRLTAQKKRNEDSKKTNEENKTLKKVSASQIGTAR
jgi:hypothetical protein